MFQIQNMQKQMKNIQSLHNWQFQSLKFQNLSNLVPGKSKHEKYHQRSLGIHKLSRKIF
jgi:hypothetical protein